MRDKVIGILQLLRPPNLFTSIADSWAGFAITGYVVVFLCSCTGFYGIEHIDRLVWLSLASFFLYGGGIVLNDYFDRYLDAEERPERPIPSGKVSANEAAFLGFIQLAIGIFCAFQVSLISMVVAFGVAACAVVYDRFGKHHAVLGPINMGMCRMGNLMLGMTASTIAFEQYWYLGFIHLIFIAAVTTVSRGEVFGGNRKAIGLAMFLYAVVFSFVTYIIVMQTVIVIWSFVFVGAFAMLVVPALLKAYADPQPKLIGKAVKMGVLSLILLDASIGSAFAGWQYGVAIALLLPVSFLSAKLFAVT